MNVTEIIGLGQLVLTLLVAYVAMMVKSSIAQLRIKSLEEERVLKEWIDDHYVSKALCDEHRSRMYGGRRQ